MENKCKNCGTQVNLKKVYLQNVVGYCSNCNCDCESDIFEIDRVSLILNDECKIEVSLDWVRENIEVIEPDEQSLIFTEDGKLQISKSWILENISLIEPDNVSINLNTDGKIEVNQAWLLNAIENSLPTRLPNPEKLKVIVSDISYEYDGANPLTVNIDYVTYLDDKLLDLENRLSVRFSNIDERLSIVNNDIQSLKNVDEETIEAIGNIATVLNGINEEFENLIEDTGWVDITSGNTEGFTKCFYKKRGNNISLKGQWKNPTTNTTFPRVLTLKGLPSNLAPNENIMDSNVAIGDTTDKLSYYRSTILTNGNVTFASVVPNNFLGQFDFYLSYVI